MIVALQLCSIVADDLGKSSLDCQGSWPRSALAEDGGQEEVGVVGDHLRAHPTLLVNEITYTATKMVKPYIPLHEHEKYPMMKFYKYSRRYHRNWPKY